MHGAFDVVTDTSCSSWTTATSTGPLLEDLVWTGARFVGVECVASRDGTILVSP